MTSTERGSVEPTSAELRAGIVQTREELGETIEALTAKLDVKTRTKDKLSHTREAAATHLRTASRGTGPRTVAAMALASLLATGLVWTWRRRG